LSWKKFGTGGIKNAMFVGEFRHSEGRAFITDANEIMLLRVREPL
jgi:hypothetical protein